MRRGTLILCDIVGNARSTFTRQRSGAVGGVSDCRRFSRHIFSVGQHRLAMRSPSGTRKRELAAPLTWRSERVLVHDTRTGMGPEPHFASMR